MADSKKDSKQTQEEPEKLVLQHAEEGKVKTRFPPEASGFLHIGHAKAALVNSMLRDKYKGQMVFRYDDTNPDKEKQDFEDAIIEDLQSLGVTWDHGPTHSSDYFPQMMAYADKLVAEGNAYCDKTLQEEMRKCRMDGIPTKYRDTPVEENQRLWAEMKAGSEEGQATCLRAKMSIDAANKALRDPVIYRVNHTPHVKTGEKYKTYPTYDFCCPIVDSLEGVTHALRTSEYRDRNEQYDWFLEKLALEHKPRLDDFSRLNMEYSLMSKRKLTLLVDTGVVDGWDDPRFPTVRGLIRRGLTVEALRAFVNVQGMSKVGNLMEWSKLWSFNNGVIDPVAPRYTCVSFDTAVRATVAGADITELTPFEKAVHKKNPELGEKTAYKAPVVYLDAADVALLAEGKDAGKEVTLMDWGNANISDIVKHYGKQPVACKLTLNGNTDVKKTYKLTWIPENSENFDVTLVEYDHLLTKKKPEDGDELEDILAKTTKYTQQAIGEAAMKALKKGDKLQLERRGFYIVDAISVEKRTATLIAIPSPIEKLNHLSAKAAWIAEQTAAAGPVAATSGDGKKDAKAAAKAVGQPADAMTLEERRAAKKAAKAASGKKKEEKKEEEASK